MDKHAFKAHGPKKGDHYFTAILHLTLASTKHKAIYMMQLLLLFDIGAKAVNIRYAVHNIVTSNAGKTMVARILGKLLHMVGILPTDKVTEVQRTDLVGEFVGHTGPKTRRKVLSIFSLQFDILLCQF